MNDKEFDIDQYLEKRFFTIPSSYDNSYSDRYGCVVINEYMIDLEDVVHIEELSIQYSSSESKHTNRFEIILYFRGKNKPLRIYIAPDNLESIYKELKAAWLYVRKTSIPFNKKFKKSIRKKIQHDLQKGETISNE